MISLIICKKLEILIKTCKRMNKYMENTTLYIALEQSTLVNSRKVHIGDISTIFCTNKDISFKVSNTEILVFSNTEQDQMVVTIMKLIELISIQFKNISIESIGSSETIVYYRNLKPMSRLSGKLKAILLMVLAFLGTAYSIMSYNGDVGAIDLLNNLYELFTGVSAQPPSTGPAMGIIAYSVGLCIGMIIFFNHGINKKNTDDPTPLQVQMRLYEQDVNKCVIIDSGRKNKTIDVD